MRTRPLLAAALLGLLLTGGCEIRQAICRHGEYPVKAVGNTTGRACVTDGRPPPAGYVRYPAGQVPKYVDDRWDRYWSTKVVDANGHIVSG